MDVFWNVQAGGGRLRGWEWLFFLGKAFGRLLGRGLMAISDKSFEAMYCGMRDGLPMIFDFKCNCLFRVWDEDKTEAWSSKEVGAVYSVEDNIEAVEDVDSMLTF